MIIYLKDEYLFFTSSNTSNIFLHSFDKSSFKLLKLYIFAQNQKSADFHQRISDFVKMQQKDAALTREKKLQKKKSLNYAFACRGSRLAGEQGFEPQQTESEAHQIVLHYYYWKSIKSAQVLYLSVFSKQQFVLSNGNLKATEGH